MIIRTHHVRKPAAPQTKSAARLSSREQRRLDNTKHPQGKFIIEDVAVPIKTEPVAEVELRVEEPEVIEQIKEESAVAPQQEEALEQVTAEPGTAIFRSKVMDELFNNYKKDPDTVPKKKYKIISIGEK